jgi:excisionase family DNA binding protein
MNELRLKFKKTREGIKKALANLEELEAELDAQNGDADRFTETLTLKELAQILGLHYNTLRLHVKAGNIPYRKIGRKYFFLKSDLPGLMKKLETEELS